MRRVGAGIAAAVLLAGLAASAALAQDADGDLHSAAPAPKGWWEGWFGGTAKPDKKDKADSKKSESVAPVVNPVEIASAARQRELAAWHRRMEVYDRLMEIAVRDNNTAMQTQLDQLRDRAWEVYQQRTAALPASGSASAGEGPPERVRKSKPLAARPAGDSVVREVKP